MDEINTPRLKIEDDIIASEMNEQQKRNALDFVAYMKANEMATDDNHFEFVIRDFKVVGGND